MQKTDSQGLRNYLYDKENDSPIFETDANYNPIVKYIKGPRVDELISKKYLENGQWKTAYYLYDGLGSVRQLVDERGRVVAEYDYLPFGEIIEAQGAQARKNPFAFQGREYDRESGLYYFRARYMDPRLGRFTSKDPLRDMLIQNWSGYMDPRLGLSASRSGCGNGCSSGWLRDPIGEKAFLQMYVKGKSAKEQRQLRQQAKKPYYLFVENNPPNQIDPYGLKTVEQCWQDHEKYMAMVNKQMADSGCPVTSVAGAGICAIACVLTGPAYPACMTVCLGWDSILFLHCWFTWGDVIRDATRMDRETTCSCIDSASDHDCDLNRDLYKGRLRCD
ncbi:MAG: RHS repeat-associated core domain-containing protein [Kiritimatiellae bacterium]|nr:RHS repeat-associated core domain-containing protein [Kiritimatiellia bacterium]